jgi:3-(3-hydroxy-phenyl)propionate hydroxylase
LSVPATLHGSALNTPDTDRFEGAMAVGSPVADAPVQIDGKPGWLLRQLAGTGFSVLLFDGPDTAALAGEIEAASKGLVPLKLVVLPCEGLAAERYDARPGTAYLLRPDQHVCARWRQPVAGKLAAALRRALALS